MCNNSSVTLAPCEFRRIYPGHPTPSRQTLRRLAALLEEYGKSRDTVRSGQPDYMQLIINRQSFQRILVKDVKRFLKMFPYKRQTVYQLLAVKSIASLSESRPRERKLFIENHHQRRSTFPSLWIRE